MPSAVRVVDRFQDLSDVDFAGFTSDGLLPSWDNAAGKVKASAVKVVGNDLLLPSAAALTWDTDVKLVRDAANVLAQRNGINAQTSYIYRSFTDAANYQRAGFLWSGNGFYVGAGSGDSAGTSPQTDIVVLRASSGKEVRINTGASNAIWTDLAPVGFRLGTAMIQVDEMVAPAAPAADQARLFAQDNGAGKTQLAVRFATGAVQVLATEP